MISGRLRFLLSLGAGVIAGLTTGLASRSEYGLLVAVIVTAGAFVVWSVATLWPMSGAETRRQALHEDVDRALSDLAVLLIMGSSLTIIGILLFLGTGHGRLLDAGLAIAAVLAVWAMLHTIYATRYARLYYIDDHGGIDFNNDEDASYRDFFYFAFNLGMTYQVSDTSVSSTKVRAAVLRHCIMAYIFGTMLLAVTINLVLNLAS